jgi:hypothetical protein
MTGQTTHLDPDVLAEFRAGLITGRRGAKVAAHLAECERCSALSDQLAEVSALLAAVPAPTMPDSVAHRLESALAAEGRSKDDSERAGGDSSRDRVRHTRPARHRGFRLVAVRVLAPAAAIIVLAAGGYGLSHLTGGPTSSTASGSAAKPAAANASAGSAKGTAGRAEFPEIPASSSFVVVNSHTDYGHATLGQQLAQQVDQEKRTSAAAGQRPSARLLACVLQLTRGVSPVLVENARYQGQPATIIVAPNGDGYTAWVMTPTCLAKLASTTLPGTSTP